MKIISFVIPGVIYDFKEKGFSFGSCSTYLSPKYFLEVFNSGEYQLKSENQNLSFKNSWILDKELLLEQNPGLCIKSPLLDVNLRKNIWVQTVKGEIIYIKNIDKERINEFRPLDYLSTDLYVKYWRILGAKVGKVINNKIIWEKSNEQSEIL